MNCFKCKEPCGLDNSQDMGVSGRMCFKCMAILGKPSDYKSRSFEVPRKGFACDGCGLFKTVLVRDFRGNQDLCRNCVKKYE